MVQGGEDLMGRYPSHKGHVILPLDGGWYVPDYMEPTEEPVTVRVAKWMIDQRESDGEPRRDVSEVTWDTSIVSGSGPALVVHVAQAADVIGAVRGDRVRITMRRIEE